jgi:xylitol oxidase
VTPVTGRADFVPETNWAGNVTFMAQVRRRPASLAEVQQVVARADRVRAIGSAHSFSSIADTAGDLVSLAGLPPTLEVDAERSQVEVAAGVRYGELGRALEEQAFALPNLGSLPHISVAGACATGTHGSGMANQTLAASVRSLTLVTATGDLVTLERGGADFDGAVVALGRLGVVASLVLDLVPSFAVAQTVVENVDQGAVAEDLVSMLSAAYSVSVFTGWDEAQGSQVWIKNRPDDPDGWRGGTQWGGRVAEARLNPVPGMPPENATPQLGEPGPWNERLPHFRYEFTPSNGDELQSEYLLPIEHAAEAWAALREISDYLRPVVQISEVRAVAGDPMWLSLTGGTTSVAFHFTWVSDQAVVAPRIAAVEERLDQYGARPHWGKLFTTPPDKLAHRYPRLGDFRRLVTELDPQGKFGNDLVDGWIGLRAAGGSQ